MFHFRFGSGCFHNRNSEESADMIVASKTEYKNLPAFGMACIKKIWEWEYENNLTSESLSERIKSSKNRAACPYEIQELKSLLQNIKWVDFIDFDENSLEQVILLFEPSWNEKVFAYEIENGYVYFEWGTSV